MNTLAGPDNFRNVKYVVIILGTLILGPILGEILGKGRNKLESESIRALIRCRLHRVHEKLLFTSRGPGFETCSFGYPR